MTSPFHDPLVVGPTDEMPERFFDRFMFNMHPVDDLAPTVILGYGVYPKRDVADGFVLVTTDAEQRAVLFSTEMSATDATGSGPMRFECSEPNEAWRLIVGPNDTGLEVDVIWRARTPYWLKSLEVATTSQETTSFDHLVQSGRYSGTITLDGIEQSVDGWYGQRDRSRGVRTMSGGQGLHIWFQAQFPDRSVGFLMVESRSGEQIMLEGAVMHEDGTLDDIVAVTHDLEFTDGLDLVSGRIVVKTEDGRTYDIGCDGSAGGGWMAAAGYGGHHGKPRGRDHSEYVVYPLDGSVSPRTVDSALTDRNCRFTWEGQEGRGIFEYALSRSSSYEYRPTSA
ncbi:hypothetical protein JNO54_04540 [Janibacter sp. YIM B02568]|uniref:DUF7064 domain-containing protein n=1 Tax=Janibacter endophyticus TaxID=2806261 RepID=UPI00194E0C73|nr:hypothetical protein [Janibacter endophyticus]MBM6545409.1 hypothetical protein [Janibacter endophyticus]